MVALPIHAYSVPPNHRRFMAVLGLLLSLFSLGGCNQNETDNRLTRLLPWLHESDSERYAASLEPELKEAWLGAAELARMQAWTLKERSYAETGHFFSDQFRASSFQISLSGGERLRLAIRTVPVEHPDAAASPLENGLPQLFAELYQEEAEGWKHVQSLSSQGEPFEFQSDEPRSVSLVIQPRLNTDVRYQLEVSQGGSLPFPVVGATLKHMGGGFGVPRDGGRRVHQGVDIFAKRGTPIVAVSDGWIRTGDTSLGGRVVWLRTPVAGVSYYYAHLDSIAVHTGQRVKRGEVIGTLGNTGNAIRTPPHLHFGIYRRMRGAVDPLPYLRPKPQEAFVHADIPHARPIQQVAAGRLHLRASPNPSGKVLARLVRGSRVHLAAAADSDWVRISTDNGLRGFVHSRWLEPAEGGTG